MTKKKVKTVAKLQPCQSHEVMARLGDKWALLVIITLSRSNEGRLRFSELKNGIAKISQRMLTLTLGFPTTQFNKRRVLRIVAVRIVKNDLEDVADQPQNESYRDSWSSVDRISPFSTPRSKIVKIIA